MRSTTICLITLVGFQILQHAVGEQENDLGRLTRLAEDVMNNLRRMQVDLEFDTYLKMHLLMVQAITNLTRPVLSEIKERSAQQDMHTIRQSKNCLPAAEKRLDELSQLIYNEQTQDCTKDFHRKYRDGAFQFTELHREGIKYSTRLNLVFEKCGSQKSDPDCGSDQLWKIEDDFKTLDNLAKTVHQNLTAFIDKELKKVMNCFEGSVTPLIPTPLSEIRQIFTNCLKG